MRYFGFALAAAAALTLHAGHALAQNTNGPGVTDKEIKLGQTMAYSGPAAIYSQMGIVNAAYFKMLNEEKGGINGRKITFLSVDDAYVPAKTVEVTRKLVESDGVLAMTGSACTPCNTAVQKYLNAKRVPTLFIPLSSPSLHDRKSNPWTVTFSYSYETEGEVYGRYIRDKRPQAKVAVLYQNDDVGKSFQKGLRRGLGDKAGAIVKEVSFETTDPTIDSQILAMQASGADTVFLFGTDKYASMAIKKIAGLGWKPQMTVGSFASSIDGTLKPAGLENSVGVMTSLWLKLPTDPTLANDKGLQDYLAFMKKWAPEVNPGGIPAIISYNTAMLTAMTLEKSGNDLSRENVLKQATSWKDISLPMVLPGVVLDLQTDGSTGSAIQQARLMRFDGTRYVAVND